MNWLPMGILAVLLALPAEAEIYKWVAPDGHVTYSSSPMPGARRLEFSSMPGARRNFSGGGSAIGSPGDFPRVDGQTQRGRDDMRRKILEQELFAEEGLLAEARRKPADGGRDALLHEKNIQALRAELSRVK